MKDRKQGGKGGSLEKTLKLFKIYYYTPGKEKLKKKPKKPTSTKKPQQTQTQLILLL